MIFTILIGIAVIAYAILLYGISLSFQARTGDPKEYHNAGTRFSIIIPFRNEEKNLPKLLDSLKKIRYPAQLFEVIFTDDHSSDHSVSIIESAREELKFQVQILKGSHEGNGKKFALAHGISQATGDYILTTDADCILPENILTAHNHLISEHSCKMISGPVVYTQSENDGFLGMFQLVENAGLVVLGAWGISRAKPFMANGANLCFEKNAFFAVHGYEGNYHIPGGDDEFLMDKFNAAYPGRIYFLYDSTAMVHTPVQSTLAGFLNQRIRWASKGKSKKDKTVFAVQIFMFLMFTSLLVSAVKAIFMIHPLQNLSLIGIKIIADMAFYNHIAPFFKLRVSMLQVAASSCLQILFTPWIALSSLSGKFIWKDRVYKN